MRLNDLENKNYAATALKENFELNLDTSKLDKINTKKMLKKVSSLIEEAKQSSDFYKDQSGPTYLKLVFMEQALRKHFQDLMNKPTRIVVENEEVEKSQVVLAAQDMVDTIQKMLEDVGQMQVKELPALTDSIESEMGVNEAQSYNEQVTTQLDALSAVLKEAFAQIKAARDTLTGTTPAGEAFTAGAELGAEAGAEAGAELGAEAGAEMASEPMPTPEPPAEEPEAAPVAGAGRAKR